ncbi:hypothetical protein KR074_008988 [Drosophila pseudoananassae]|nr:hypothetical protein KR074_008988 [Drosophila pseudoananassae]
MQSKKQLGGQSRSRRSPVMLSVFLRGEDAPNPSQAESQNNNPSQTNRYIGSIPSNGNREESDVSPVLTPSTSFGSSVMGIPPRPPTSARPSVNVWGSVESKDVAKASAGKKFKLNVEEYPELGTHTKRSKVAPSLGADSQQNSVSSGTSSNDGNLRLPRSRLVPAPVLANYFPDSVFPPAENTAGSSFVRETIPLPTPGQQQESGKKPGAVTSATVSAHPPKRQVPNLKAMKESSKGLQGQVCHGGGDSDAEDAEIPPSQEEEDNDGFIVVKSRKRRVVRVPSWGAMSHNSTPKSQPPTAAHTKMQQKSTTGASSVQEGQREHPQPQNKSNRSSPQNRQRQDRQVRPAPQASSNQSPPKNANESQTPLVPAQQQPRATKQQAEQQPQLSGVQLGQNSTPQPLLKTPPPSIQQSQIQLQVEQPHHQVCQTPAQVQLEQQSREEVQPQPQHQLRKRSHSSFQQRPSPYDLKQRPSQTLKLQQRSHSNGPDQQLFVPSPGSSLRATQSEPQLPPTEDDSYHRPARREWMYERQKFEKEQEQENITRLARFSSLNANAQEFTPRDRVNQQLQQADQQEQQVASICRPSQRRLRQRYRRTLRRNGLLGSPGQGSSGSEPQILFYAPQGPNQGEENSPQSPPHYCPPKTNIYPTPVAPLTLGLAPPAIYQLYPKLPPPSVTMGAGSETSSVIYYNPQTQQSWSTNATPTEIQNRIGNGYQSVFRLASLPTTGVGTPSSDSSTGWGSLQGNNRSSMAMSMVRSLSIPPSTITGPQQFMSHTLSSTEERADQSGWQATNRDLMYSQPLLDMDREDTPSPSRQWGSGCRRTERHGAEEVVEVTAAVPSTVLYPEDGELIDLDAEAGGRWRNRNPEVYYMLFRTPADNKAMYHDYPHPDFNCIPSSIRSLYRLVTAKYSSYAFIYVLCAQLCRDCGPIDCYGNLKIALLTSIVSIEPGEVRPPIPMCVIATDSLVCRRIMTSMGKLAPRFVATGDQDIQQTAHALPQRSNWRPSTPLIMAQRGVFYVSDWSRQSNANIAYLERCIENGSVPIPQTQEHQSLDAAIWTYWEKANPANPNVIISKFCPLFGFPIYMPENVEESLYIYYLMEASEDRDEDGWDIPTEDISMMLHVFSNRTSSMTSSAEKLLKKYYFASRRDRPAAFSAKTYEVLKQMSEALAKLSFRVEVVETDVCAAIYQCETFMQKFFGSGSTRPSPDVPAGFKNMSEIDPHMNEFSRWLHSYLNRYSDEDLGMKPARQPPKANDWGCP